MNRRSLMLGAGATLTGATATLVNSPAAAAAKSTLYPMGPSGGTFGSPFSDTAVPKGSRIAELRIGEGSSPTGLDFLQLSLTGRSGLVIFPVHGGSTSSTLTTAIFFDADEFIKSIDGSLQQNAVISTIRIVTNKRAYTIGRPSNVFGSYRFAAPAGFEIISFNGLSSGFISAIGVNIRKLGG